ncbi:beta-lactamase/transpeptidase-like protein [Hyaloraphidium curvatum]|nr:beta-lactamase/transpeptidase-like protein [Hyaloraphidium curvatum]
MRLPAALAAVAAACVAPAALVAAGPVCVAPAGGPVFAGSGWTCIAANGGWLPVKLTPWGNSACMSIDSQACVVAGDRTCCDGLAATGTSSTPYLECGPIHKAIYGDDGYGSPDGWCSRALGALGSAVVVHRDDLGKGTVSEALASAVAKAFAEISAPGLIVAVETSQGRWVTTLGSQEWPARSPMEPGLRQRIGSVTKTFTVSALLQLAERGNLSLEDPIGKYVGGLPRPEATLRQLASMRSGIPSYTFDEGFQDQLFADPYKPWTPDGLVDIVRNNPGEFGPEQGSFEPGTRTFYSNTNTILLGMVIEQVTGKPLHQVIQENVLDVLGMSDTVFPTDAAFPDPHARGYTLQGQADGKPADSSDWNPSWGWAAGAMISSLDDLLAYAKALVDGRPGFLGPEMQAARINSFDFSIPGNSPSRSYGLGLGYSNGWYGHTGELPGFNTVLQRHRERATTIMVMANSDIAAGECPPGVPVLPDGPRVGKCDNPAVHVAGAIAEALGLPLA